MRIINCNGSEEKSESGEKSSKLPKALTQECLVRAKMEDPEKQRERAEAVRSRSVHELAQITSLSDIPLPSFMSRSSSRPVERKKRFREK